MMRRPPPAAVYPGEPDPATATGPGTKSDPVTPVDLSGKWIALFGRTPEGSVDSAWQTGEVVEFERNGGLIWTKMTGSQPASFRYELKGNEMAIIPGEVANIGRYDEVGLMNVGRDDEVGINKGEQPGQSGKKLVPFGRPFSVMAATWR